MNPLFWWLLCRLAAASRLLLAALIALAKWATPRAWQAWMTGSLAAVDLVERASIRAYRRWDSRHDAVVLEELGPQHALPRIPHGHVLWSEINKEQPR